MTDTFVDVEAEGSAGDDLVPRRFVIGGLVVEVLELVDWWPRDDHEYYKLRGDDGGVYLLRYDANLDVWQQMRVSETR